jgi:GDP-D-mannose 3',5'-epimerase
MKKAIVFGAGGFIGHHLVKRLKSEGYWVRGVDLKYPDFGKTAADHFVIGDLRRKEVVSRVLTPEADELYQLAADMGGAGYLFTGDNDAKVMYNSASINLNTLEAARLCSVNKLFYSSSACIYPKHNQEDPISPNCEEKSAYPADPDSEYGWEKLFSERLYQAFHRNHGLNVRIARLHNVYGPEGPWRGGKEKAPAAICKKVAEAKDGDFIEIWGDGHQTRSFLFIEDCLDGIRHLMNADYTEPVNIGSEEMVSILELVELLCRLSNKKMFIRSVDGPVGVRGRNSDNRLMRKITGWEPRTRLEDGIRNTYLWVERQVASEYVKLS